MTKKIVLTALVAVFATALALAQTDRKAAAPVSKTSPANKTEKVEKAQQKDKAAKIEHAEERSNGAAFSGKGKGGDKNTVDKQNKGKGKGKGKHHNKNKSKAKNGYKTKDKVKDKEKDDNDENVGEKDRSGTQQGRKPGTSTDKAPMKKQRKPGDKPAPGTEVKKDQKTRG